MVGVTFSVLLLGLRGLEAPRRVREALGVSAKWLSEISYSLYLFHFPVVLWLYAARFAGERRAPGLASLLEYTVWLLVLIALGAAAWWLFERHTGRVRGWLAKGWSTFSGRA